MPNKLSVGDIVRVIDEDCVHYGAQGQVVGFNESNEEAPVRVWFGKEADHLPPHPISHELELDTRFAVDPPVPAEERNCIRVWDYPSSELEVCSTWTMKTLADRYFGKFYHTYYEPKEEFVSGAKDCDVEHCPNKTERRIIFNIWGSVCFADVCASCAPKYHLLCGDMFPWKKRESKQVEST